MKFEIKDILYLVVIAVGFVGSWQVNEYKVNELQKSVSKLEAERDALIVVQTQQESIKARLDKSDEKIDKIYQLVLSLSRN